SVSECSEIIFKVAGNGLKIDFLDAWIGVIGFGLQLYFDFSGYSDMAIGLARMFGIKFPRNFDSPYRSRSIVEFWKRWHITLTRFFREYLYFPLGGNRCGKVRQMVNIMVTMLLSGLWHGAGWTFLIWGGLHGLYLVTAHQWERLLKHRQWLWRSTRKYAILSYFLTFLSVMIAWVFFKMNSVVLALKYVGAMLAFNGFELSTQVSADSPKLANFLRKIGFRYVSDTCHVTDYAYHVSLIMMVLAIALFLPNTQQLLAKYDPVLEPTRAGRFQLRMGTSLSLAMGIGFAAVLRSFFSAAPTPFLYFNF
ncbi:MAG: Peptidoglycan O-acetyltransferase, partial [Verrucomicrobiales bacterium]|nr:Peptidoglycan O-acetyltransferase [Verrucomicrobiales bacterium]